MQRKGGAGQGMVWQGSAGPGKYSELKKKEKGTTDLGKGRIRQSRTAYYERQGRAVWNRVQDKTDCTDREGEGAGLRAGQS